jgi:hypothetical protein
MVAMDQSFTEMRAARMLDRWPATTAPRAPAGGAGSVRVEACGEAEDIGLAAVRGGYRVDKRAMRRVRTAPIPEPVGRFIGPAGLRLEAPLAIKWRVLTGQIAAMAAQQGGRV